VQSRLVRIPRHLLHVGLDDLSQLGVPSTARDALRALLADLPLVPDASSSAQLVGPSAITLPCLAVLARHVGQGLRDQNLAIGHEDRERLRLERAKLVFLTADALADAIAHGDERPLHEAVVFVVETTAAALPLLASRDAAGLATYVTAQAPSADLAHWRCVNLTA
jgi:hypothetical protein